MARNDSASSGFESVLPLVGAGYKKPAAPLAERLVRALCVVGLLVALGSTLRLLGLVWGFGWGVLRFPWGAEPAMLVAAVGGLLLLVAAALLMLGAVGELFTRHWSRRVLALYLMTWLVGWLVAAGGQLALQWEYWPSEGRPFVGLLAGQLGELLVEASYPVLLLICLSWKDTRRAATVRRGFSPLMPGPPPPDRSPRSPE